MEQTRAERNKRYEELKEIMSTTRDQKTYHEAWIEQARIRGLNIRDERANTKQAARFAGGLFKEKPKDEPLRIYRF